MQTILSPEALQKRCLDWRGQGLSIALVPTMGFFHAGHESLMQAGRARADKLVVSLFVNPTQFGPTEDLATYPRDPEKDASIAQSHGVDVLFTPQAGDMYHKDHATWIEVPDLARNLCGASRPTHFRGVCTVVNKLFMLVQPTVAFFGQKDWQQLAIIRRMVRDLAIPVLVEGMPIVRESDGLALSSRNAYLTEEERVQAPHFSRGLALAVELARAGTRSTRELSAAVRGYWRNHLPLAKEDYLAFVHPDTLGALAEVTGSFLVAAAVHMSRARLLDNFQTATG